MAIEKMIDSSAKLIEPIKLRQLELTNRIIDNSKSNDDEIECELTVNLDSNDPIRI